MRSTTGPAGRAPLASSAATDGIIPSWRAPRQTGEISGAVTRCSGCPELGLPIPPPNATRRARRMISRGWDGTHDAGRTGHGLALARHSIRDADDGQDAGADGRPRADPRARYRGEHHDLQRREFGGAASTAVRAAGSSGAGVHRVSTGPRAVPVL